MSNCNSTLHFISGKLGSGKTTLAKDIAQGQQAIFISEDIWLATLFPDEISNFQDYLLYSKRVRELIAYHTVELLQHGVSVVFDFAGNRPAERCWVKSIFEQANAAHVLHHIVASDELCKAQYKKRNLNLPKGSKVISDQEFDEITRHFAPPEQSEGFNLKNYYREG